eukprot:scaffold1437_cov353-Prasinococcus_capsulatus_cf.AAC.5
MEEDFRTHNRKARSLTVHFRSTLRADHRVGSSILPARTAEYAYVLSAPCSVHMQSNWIAGRTSELTNTHSRTCSMPQGCVMGTNPFHGLL